MKPTGWSGEKVCRPVYAFIYGASPVGTYMYSGLSGDLHGAPLGFHQLRHSGRSSPVEILTLETPGGLYQWGPSWRSSLVTRGLQYSRMSAGFPKGTLKGPTHSLCYSSARSPLDFNKI
jgi:hypothetical protein